MYPTLKYQSLSRSNILQNTHFLPKIPVFHIQLITTVDQTIYFATHLGGVGVEIMCIIVIKNNLVTAWRDVMTHE